MPGKRFTRLLMGLCGAMALGALVPATALAPADLSITKTDSPDPVLEGQQITYTITATNNGPDSAANVTVKDDLPSSDFDLISATPSQGGACDTNAQKVDCNLGTLTSGASATVTIVVTAKKPGAVSNTATVTSDEPEVDPGNNSATETTTVQDANPPGHGPGGPTCKGKSATIVGTEAADSLNGTDKADVFVTLGGNDVVNGLGGKDRICTGAGDDTAKGQADGDVVRGGGGNDAVKGGGGNDSVGGGSGNDRVGGGSGSDALNGGTGKDRCNGGPGRDTQRSC